MDARTTRLGTFALIVAFGLLPGVAGVVQTNDAVTRTFDVKVIFQVDNKDENPFGSFRFSLPPVAYHLGARQTTNNKAGTVFVPPNQNFWGMFDGLRVDQVLCGQGNNGPVTCMPDEDESVAVLARCDKDDATFLPSPADGKSRLPLGFGSRAIDCEEFQDAVLYYDGAPTGYCEAWAFVPNAWGTNGCFIQVEDIVPLGNGVNDTGYIVTCMRTTALVTDPHKPQIGPYMRTFETHDYILVLDLDGTPENLAQATQQHSGNSLQGWHDLGGKNGFPCPDGDDPPDKKGEGLHPGPTPLSPK